MGVLVAIQVEAVVVGVVPAPRVVAEVGARTAAVLVVVPDIPSCVAGVP